VDRDISPFPGSGILPPDRDGLLGSYLCEASLIIIEGETEMKTAFVCVMGAAFLALAGCEYNNSHPGGPGAAQGTESSHGFAQKDDTFSLSVPTLSTHIKQGETKTISLAIKRGKEFDQDVKLAFSGLPKGLTVEPASHSIKATSDDVKVTLTAAEDAALGDFSIKVTGAPARGAVADSELKVTVTKK
jgi:hypothetical protein